MLAAQQGFTQEWFFCRGMFNQSTNQILAYPAADQLPAAAPSTSGGKRRPDEGADSGDAVATASEVQATAPNKRQNKASATERSSRLLGQDVASDASCCQQLAAVACSTACS